MLELQISGRHVAVDATVARMRPIAMGFIPFIHDHETECVEQHLPKSGSQFIRMSGWKQADFARQIEVEERDFAVSTALRRVGNDGAGDGSL
jgi:hypothetical protein